MNDNLIRDDGVIKGCPSNKVKMGWWKTFRCFHSYRKEAMNVYYSWEDIKDAFFVFTSLVLIIVLFPILPLIKSIFDYRKAVKRVRAEK